MTNAAGKLRGAGAIARRLRRLAGDEGVRARALCGTFWTVVHFGGENALRLASNLILTRLLFPEAFGMMAIVQVFLTGLQLLSDTGIRTSIIQNDRDDADFLNTAWTVQVGRGVLLWLASCALALPIAAIYDEPMLAQLLPVAGLTALVLGFGTTNMFSVNRHLMLGRFTLLTLVSQVIAIAAMVALAWTLRSVWALVLGGLIGTVVGVALNWMFLPGIRNRFRWEPRAARQLFHFGKYIFLGTAAGFVVNNADRAVLGGFADLGLLGVYTIAYFLASVPQLVKQALTSKVIFPLYRMKSPMGNDENRRKLFRARRLLIGATLAANAVLAFSSVVLIEVLYDPRYAAAGPMMVLFGLAMVPRIVYGGYTGVLLAHGDSRRQFYLSVATAVLQTVLLVPGIVWFGVAGAILAPGLAALLTIPLRTRYAGRYDAVDRTDEAFLGAGLALQLAACWLWRDEILALLG